MSAVTSILVFVLLLWIAARTTGYAAWNWKNHNKSGSVMILIVAVGSVALPAYIVFFKS